MKLKEISLTLGRKDTIKREDGGFFSNEISLTKTIELENGDIEEKVMEALKSSIKHEVSEHFNPFKKEK